VSMRQGERGCNSPRPCRNLERGLNVRVLRVYHAGRSEAQQARELALAALGVDVTLVVPASWPGVEGGGPIRANRAFDRIELEVIRAGDVNRHGYRDPSKVARLIADGQPDVLDVHEEPFSVAARQWLSAAPARLPIVMYTAQNIDKRYPPPFARCERQAYRRADALYPCSRQAASVARGKGFSGLIEVLPLGFDPEIFHPGEQSLGDRELVIALAGRLVAEKGIRDAVEVLAGVRTRNPKLVIIGSGPEERPVQELAAALGVSERLEMVPWLPPERLADVFRRAHVVLIPTLSTSTWTEQFGRVIVEAQASGAVVAGYLSGAIPEIAGAAAILSPAGDAQALARSVSDVLGDPTDFARRREEGIALSASRTWARVAQQHALVYRKVVDGDFERLRLPRSPKARRELAREEFGETAATPAGRRPFALPLLRRGGVVPSMVAGALDAYAEAAAGLGIARRAGPGQKFVS
jgi:glycosyltransferase involved in cell wall biosynthesis